MAKSYKYTMKMSLSVLNHLGLNLYSNVPAVLSEVVANSWDADAEKVEINIDVDNDKIEIIDDGNGMDLNDINDKYLNVGYQKRDSEGVYTPRLKRHVMGRKGIGKLSLFSIANRVEIHSVKGRQKNGFLMTVPQIKKQIGSSKEYHPDEVAENKIVIKKGTKIILSDLKRKISLSEVALRKRLARRFSVIGDKNKFQVAINGTPVTIADRDFFKSIQFLWTIGDAGKEFTSECTNLKETAHFEGNVDESNKYEISGWIREMHQIAGKVGESVSSSRPQSSR